MKTLIPRPAALLAALAFGAALDAAPLLAGDAPAAPGFEGIGSAALAAMKAKADALGVKGVALVAFAPGDSVASWSSRMLVVGALAKGPSGTEQGYNFLAIAYSKAGEMAETLKDSGSGSRKEYAGEVGWQGGAVARGRTGHLFAAFSGGKSEQDYEISKAGLAVLAGSL